MARITSGTRGYLGACAAAWWLLCWTSAGGAPSRPSEQEPPQTVRVAVCQTLCIDSDIEGNLRRIEYAVEDAASQGAQIACFAETPVIGWINPEVHTLAEPIPGPLSDRLASMAQRHHIMIATGLSEREGDAVYDSAVLISTEGEILLKHRKINTLGELLDPPYARGSVEEVRAVETPIGRVGMLICADTFIEKNVAALGAQRPDLVIVPYGWAADPGDWPGHGTNLAAWVSSVAVRAECPVVGTDLVGSVSAGPWKGKTYGGQSVVADGAGRVLGVLRDRDCEVRVFEIVVGREQDEHGP